MSTNSVIGVMHGDNCKAVYCHSDGYLSYNGQVLLDNYDSAKANHLVSLGDISSLGKRILPTEGSDHSFDNREEGVTTFYGRDRGESDVEFTSVSSFAQLCEYFDSAYYYIMKDGVWYVSIGGAQLLVLSEVLTKEVA